MAIHEFNPKIYYNAFGTYTPVLRISDGDTVITSTVDNAGRDAADRQVTRPGNPLTGPFYIND
ncbi:acetamidase, partial [Candidatus Bathyarchaeota archaeon]